MIRLITQAGTIKSTRADLLVYFLFEDGEAFRVQLTTLQNLIGEEILPSQDWPFSGKERETLLLFPKKLRTPRLLLVGAGKSDEWSAERLRRASAHAAKTAQALNVQNAAILEPDPARIASLAPSSPQEASDVYGSAVAEGILLGLYRFDRYLTQEKPRAKSLKLVYLVSESPTRRRSIAQAAARARMICEATCFARDLSNAPGSEIYPESLAAAAQRAGRRHGFAVDV
ncbi:MAG TPA: M17 family peptidase N-terminal domain-containing protein, partial [Bacteroidota bacterium]|nr:M17 family peptidase N-terminal domain-containing protein [Bacteroidota bacterium]